MSNLTIGILGGMGPRATVYFEQKLLEKCKGPDQSLPRLIVVNDGTIPDRTAFLCGQGEDPVPALRRNVRALMAHQPDIVCLPCNTAHAARIVGRLRAEQMPLVDMPEEAMRQAERGGHGRVLVLGTEGTKLARVYDDRAANAEVLYPTAADQAVVNRLIAATKHHGFCGACRQALAEVIGKADCDAVILACTELSMLNQGLSTAVPVVDALEALVDACLAASNTGYAITNQ